MADLEAHDLSQLNTREVKRVTARSSSVTSGLLSPRFSNPFTLSMFRTDVILLLFDSYEPGRHCLVYDRIEKGNRRSPPPPHGRGAYPRPTKPGQEARPLADCKPTRIGRGTQVGPYSWYRLRLRGLRWIARAAVSVAQIILSTVPIQPFFPINEFFRDMTTPNMQYLSSEQALADAAVFIRSINKYKNYQNPKWITFGGSYSGWPS